MIICFSGVLVDVVVKGLLAVETGSVASNAAVNDVKSRTANRRGETSTAVLLYLFFRIGKPPLHYNSLKYIIFNYS